MPPVGRLDRGMSEPGYSDRVDLTRHTHARIRATAQRPATAAWDDHLRVKEPR